MSDRQLTGSSSLPGTSSDKTGVHALSTPVTLRRRCQVGHSRTIEPTSVTVNEHPSINRKTVDWIYRLSRRGSSTVVSASSADQLQQPFVQD